MAGEIDLLALMVTLSAQANRISAEQSNGEPRVEGDSPPEIPGQVPYDSSGHISVFAPRSYDEIFEFPTIYKSVMTGQRDYGFKEDYFSWNLVDLRRAVLTDSGYRSNYVYETGQLNSNFSDYLDFQIMSSSRSTYEIETYPPLQQENWNYYRSQGKARISMVMNNSQITAAKLIILKDFNLWFDHPTGPDLNVEVPLTCIRSFKSLD